MCLYPYLPRTSRTVLETVGVLAADQQIVWHTPEVDAGYSLAPLAPLFAKVEFETEE